MALEQAVENDTVLITNSNGKIQACQVQTTVANPAASSTHAAVIAAQGAGIRIRVVALFAQSGATPTTIVFESSTGNAAISPTFQNGANGGVVLPYNPKGWFDTVAGDALNATTGAGSTTGLLLKWIAIS